MARLDEIKEILNTLRIALSITVGIIVLLIVNKLSKKTKEIKDL